MNKNVAVIICTRNRADSLRDTLASLAGVVVPDGWDVQVLVIDNGSTDGTAEVVKGGCGSLRVRYVREPARGKSRALNAGLAAVPDVGIAMFTDDDVRFPADWLSRMCQPIIRGEADAVAGGVRIAPHLLRPWMGIAHKRWLASTEGIEAWPEPFLIGANMAVSRAVLEEVGGFDPEVGPGAIGHAEDHLFTLQVHRAGFCVAFAYDVEVEHHFDEGRLCRAWFLQTARRRGEMLAYLHQHWFQSEFRRPWMQLARAVVRLGLERLVNLPATFSRSTVPESELEYWVGIHFYRRFLFERKRERRYRDGRFIGARSIGATPAVHEAITQ